MQALYTWVHEVLGMCFYTLPFFGVCLAMIIVGFVHWHKQKKRDDEFEDMMEDKLKKIEEATAAAAAAAEAVTEA